MKPYPEGFPHFDTEEELYALIQQGLDSGEGTEMTPEAWRKLSLEFGVTLDDEQRLAS